MNGSGVGQVGGLFRGKNPAKKVFAAG